MGTYDDSCGPSRGPIYFIGGDGSRWSAEIDRVIAAGARCGYVLARGLWDKRGVPRGAHSSRTCLRSVFRLTSRCTPDVRMIWPVAGRGRPRKRHVPDILSMAAEDMLAEATWQNVSWRTGTKGKLRARCATILVA